MTTDHPQPSERNELTGQPRDLDPTDLLRAMLAISPEDAAAVREDAAEAMRSGELTSER